MTTFIIATLLFLFGYTLNMFYVSVLYHRGLTHKAVLLGPKMMKFLSLTGVWITGLDPKAWATMHRFHHLHSDGEKDPHSPVHQGLFGVWKGQYVNYIDLMKKLINKSDPVVNAMAADIPFEVSWASKKNLSTAPYVLHTLFAFALVYFFNSWLIGAAYAFGIMSHPVQGWLVNAFAHMYGKRNFETPDNSRNNFLVGYFVFGEGFQNNHHANPESAKFSYRFPEVDFGYWMCLVGEFCGLFTIRRANLI